MEVYRQELLTDVLEPSPELVEVQALMPIDPADRERLKEDIAKDGIRDAIKVYKNGSKYYILGGYNRWRIAQELGIRTVPVEIYYLPEDERRDLVIKDNLNRRHLTREQKQRLIEFYLRKEPEQSDRVIAKKTGSDHKTVGAIREKLESGGEIPHLDKRVGKDGKAQKAEKAFASSRPSPASFPVYEEKTSVKTGKPLGNLKANEIANIILNSGYDYYELRKIALTSLEECLKACEKPYRVHIIKEVKQLLKRFG